MGNQFSQGYVDYINSPAWAMKRAQKIQQVGTNCQRCGAGLTLNKIHCHHLSYERFGDEDLADLQILCQPCHQRADAERNGMVVVPVEYVMAIEKILAMFRCGDSMHRLITENEKLRVRLSELDPEFTLAGEVTVAACDYRRREIMKQLEACGANP